MPTVLATKALLPDGWARDVRIQIDPTGDIERIEADQVADELDEPVRGIVLPGVPNVHSHAFQRALAGRTERGSARADTFWTWRERMYELVGRMRPEALEAVAAQLFVEMLEAGYTAVGEFHYLFGPAGSGAEGPGDPADWSRRVISASLRTGIALTHLPTLYLASDFGGVPLDSRQRSFSVDEDRLLELIATLSSGLELDPDRRVGLALHSLRAVPPDALHRALEAFEALDPEGPIHIHVAEQRREVDACMEWSGARPVEWLLAQAPVDGRWCLIHATHSTDEEVGAVARSGAIVGLCPTTEANLGDGAFPLAGLQSAGGAFAIGSDSHVSVSPVEELRWLEYGQRLLTETRNVAAGAEDRSTGRALFQAAVEHGSRALGRVAGALAPGRRGDLIVLDESHPGLLAREGDDLLDGWIFSASTSAVRDVMVGGRWVVRDGRHPLRDETRAAFERALSTLWG